MKEPKKTAKQHFAEQRAIAAGEPEAAKGSRKNTKKRSAKKKS